MTRTENKGEGATRGMRWLARVAGSLMAGFWLLAGLAFALVEREPFTLESASMAALILAVTMAAIVSWRDERIGGTLLTIAGLAFGAFAYLSEGRNKGYAMLVSGAPFVIAGVLLLAAWWRSQGGDGQS